MSVEGPGRLVLPSGFVVGNLLLILDNMRSLPGCRAPEGEPFNRNVCWFQFLLFVKPRHGVKFLSFVFSCSKAFLSSLQHFNA